jgi:hypothetical protein
MFMNVVLAKKIEDHIIATLWSYERVYRRNEGDTLCFSQIALFELFNVVEPVTAIFFNRVVHGMRNVGLLVFRRDGEAVSLSETKRTYLWSGGFSSCGGAR